MTEPDRLKVVVRDGESVETPPEQFALTDTGNGRRFAWRHGKDFRYCAPERSWYIYDGTRFTRDGRQEAMMRAKETVRSMHEESRSEMDEHRSAALAKHAIACESMARLKALLEAAESELPVTPDEWDRDPYLLNCMNGTLDLRTFELKPHRRGDLLVKRAGVAYDPSATCPRFMAFLEHIMNGSAEKIAYLQRFFGYALTALIRERVIVFLIGTGANGKSVLIDIVHYILGDYSVTTDPGTVMKRERKEQSNDVARLRNTRFVSSIELDEGERMAESHVKHLTGGDRIVARELYKEYIEFAPTFKICIGSNYKPLVRGNDPAIWSRIHLVPFTVSIPEAEQDAQLKDRLKAEEGPGILNWMIEGCRSWQIIGLRPPPEVKAATDEYRAEMDILEQFLDERCIRLPDVWVLANDLYHAYVEWCESRGYRSAPTQTRFGLDIAKLGFEKGREQTASRRSLWRGVGLLNPALEQLEELEQFTDKSSHEGKEKKSWETPPNSSKLLQTPPEIQQETF